MRAMMSSYQKELNGIVVEANNAIEKKNQNSLLFEKIEEVRGMAVKIEKTIRKENSENLGLIRTLDKEVEEVNFLADFEQSLTRQREEMKEMEEQIKNFHLILQNKDELLDKKIKMKEEQFERYIQENNMKYQKWV